MPRTTWVCEKCFSSHETREKAEECEKAHPGVGDVEVVGLRFHQTGHPGKRPGVSFGDRIQAQQVPRMLNVRWGPKPSDVAEYTLSHVGPRGV